MEPMLEGYSTVSYLAAVTQRIRLGILVTGNIYRHPGILVKAVTTLDVLSGGRACLGIGAGWFEREAKDLGVPFPPVRERFERLEETLQIAKQMWRGDHSPFKGRYYQLDEPINSPQPLSRPHPPILIGGQGEKKTLRLVSKYGDACNFYFGSLWKNRSLEDRERYQNNLERMVRKLGILKDHCGKVGRSYDDIERSVLCNITIAPDAMNPTDLVGSCQELGEIGFQHVIVNMPNFHEIEPLRTIGREVIPKVARLP
jgi:F420-dependent oxidoreductase-like protein